LARKPGSDAIFVQRASTCTTAEAEPDCAEAANSHYLQVSECGAEYSLTPFVVGRGLSAALALQTRACDGTVVPKRKLIRRFFYLSPDDVLNYVDVTPNGMTAPVALVENIEQMQIEYGIDADGDGTPDSFAPVPADWTQVIGARLWVLARSATPSPNVRSALEFRMSDTTVAVPAAATNLKRRVHSTYVSFLTPKARRES
jgi:type IV pilus assembly protein PilW